MVGVHTMTKPSSLYGAKRRASIRKGKESKAADEIREKMKNWMPHHMPALHKLPVKLDEYEHQLKAFTTYIQNEYKDIKRLRLCYQYITSYITEGNRIGRWNLRVPANLIKIRRSKTSRTASFFRVGTEVGRLHKAWRDDIKSKSSPPKDSLERLADALISAVIHSGLANPRAVACLANTLSTQSKPFNEMKGLFWVDLAWVSATDPINCRGVENDTVINRTLYRFYPNSFTLGLINSFYNSRKDATPLQDFDVKNTWDLIRKRLAIASPNTKLLKLSQFCVGAQSVTEMLDQVEIPQVLLECAAGRQSTVSLLPEHHIDWIYQRPNQNLTSSIEFLQITPWDNIKPSDVKSGKVKLHHGADGLSAQIRSALQTEDNGIKHSASQATVALQQLVNSERTTSELTLINWLISCLSVNKISTALRYFIEVGDLWFYYFGDQDLSAFDEADLESIYELMLSLKEKPNAKEYLRGRLSDLHAFASFQYGLPTLKEYFLGAGPTRNQVIINAGYIPELGYQAILSNINNVHDLDPHAVEGLRLLVILAYRTGLRRGELLKLRLSDIEESGNPWLFIVNNRYGNNKTDSALRKIPLTPLLLNNELSAFKNYLGRRRAFSQNQPNTLLFSLPHSPTIPHKGHSISELIKRSLVKQGYLNLTFHHLRHSALTNLMLVMDGNNELIEMLTAYTKEQAAEIRKELYSTNPESKRDAFWVISGIAGHLTPETTFTNYIHITDLILSKRLEDYNPALTLTESRYISGLSSGYLNHQLKVRALDNPPKHDHSFNLNELSNQIKKRLTSKSNTISEPKPIQINQPVEATEQQRAANVTDCYAVLKAIEDGDSIVVAAVNYAVDEKRIRQWIDNAAALQQITTIHGNTRLFSKSRVKTNIGKPLLPARPNDRSVLVEIDNSINKIRDIFKVDREGVIWVINYWLNNSMTSKSGIRFTDHTELERFIKILEEAIPLKRWHLHLAVPNAVKQLELNKWKSFKFGSIQEDNLPASQSIHAYLHLKHSNEANILAKRKAKMSRYSSSLIRYVFHMLAIMIGVNG